MRESKWPVMLNVIQEFARCDKIVLATGLDRLRMRCNRYLVYNRCIIILDWHMYAGEIKTCRFLRFHGQG